MNATTATFEYNGHTVSLRPEEVVLGHKQYAVHVRRGAPQHLRCKLIVGIRYNVLIDGKEILKRTLKRQGTKRAKEIIDAASK